MIVSSKTQLNRYLNLNNNLDIALNYLMNTDLTQLPLGKTIINDDVFVNVMDYYADGVLDNFYEAHRLYLDIHTVAFGQEKMSYLDLDQATLIKEFDVENDIGFYQGQSQSTILITKDQFLIVFPEDVHQPKIKINDDLVRKIVVKVKL